MWEGNLLIRLPSSEGIIAALNMIIKAFEGPIEIEVTKARWEEIKRLQLNPIVETVT